jgi:hypothetical protein
LIILIANAHPYLIVLADLVRSLALAGCQNDPASRSRMIGSTEWPGSLQGSKPFKKPELPFTALARSDVIDVFGPCLSDERAGVHQAWVLKTSFSRFVR